MSRNIKYAFALMGLATLAACSSDLPEVFPNGSDEIRVCLKHGIANRVKAQAPAGYRDWNQTTDPTTMGVIAFTDGITDSYIYNNVSFSAPAEGATAWACDAAVRKQWKEYYSATSLDFFAYMPHTANATVSQSSNTFTLTLPSVPGITTKPYLVATTPVRYASALGNLTPVPFQMDQLMTAFEFQFALGADMGNLRTFRITKVKMSHVLTSASVEQAYTLADGTWTKGTTTIHPASDHQASAEITSTEGIKIGYNNNPTEAKVFPGMFYMLPYDLSAVAPKIDVTYEVYDQDGYKTRSTTSEIELNKENFSSLTSVQTAHKNIIKIKIVPTSLHVLSDADQSTSGYLVVGK